MPLRSRVRPYFFLRKLRIRIALPKPAYERGHCMLGSVLCASVWAKHNMGDVLPPLSPRYEMAPANRHIMHTKCGGKTLSSNVQLRPMPLCGDNGSFLLKSIGPSCNRPLPMHRAKMPLGWGLRSVEDPRSYSESGCTCP